MPRPASRHQPILLARIVVSSADASQDYFLLQERALELNLPTVQVYSNERTFYDPERRYFKERI